MFCTCMETCPFAKNEFGYVLCSGRELKGLKDVVKFDTGAVVEHAIEFFVHSRARYPLKLKEIEVVVFRN